MMLLINDAQSVKYCYEEKKMNLNPNLRSYNKIIPGEFWSNVKGKTIKFLEENIKEHLHDFEEDKFLNKEG